jgi:hypothetical protein
MRSSCSRTWVSRPTQAWEAKFAGAVATALCVVAKETLAIETRHLTQAWLQIYFYFGFVFLGQQD